MKFKKVLLLFLAMSMTISSLPFNVMADTVRGLSISDDAGVSPAAINLTNTQAFKFGSAQTEIEPGEYALPVKMMKATDITTESMAGSCIKGGTLTVDENGKAVVTVALQSVTIGPISDWAKEWKIYRGDLASGVTADAIAQTNAEGNVEQISFELPDNSTDGVYVNMFISVMNTTQDAYLAFDFSACGRSTTEIYTGTAHVDQFGEYDVNVTVTVTDGIITGIAVEGANFGGTYADYNKIKLQNAFEALKDMFNGKSADDAKGIDEVDTVTSATYSSNAIKSAILNALSLAVEEEVINIPTEKLAQGEYRVDIAFYTDNVKHSLVENDTAKAVINVDANGKLTLTSDVINGTVKEPLYVMDFNGYYEDNDTSKALKTDAEVTMGKVDFSDDVFEKNTPVVTKVTFPLEGEYAKIYNTNARIYVPAMKNLTGSVSGIEFDRGIFSSDCFAKIYWDSIERVPDAPRYEYGSAKTVLEPGVYTIPASLMNSGNITSPSMAGSCIVGAEVTINEDGSALVKVNLQPVTVGTISDWAEKWNVYQGNDLSSEVKPAIEGINSDGKVESIMFTLPDNSFDGVYVNMFVPVMGYSPDAYIALDFAGAKTKEPVTEDFSEATTEETTENTTESTTVITTEATTEAVTEDTTKTTTEATTKAVTEDTTETTTKAVTKETTETTTEATTKVETEDTTKTTTETTTEIVTDGTTEITTETTTEASTENSTESPVFCENAVYNVPVKMVQAANPSMESMGNGALDGNAIVTVKDGGSTVELSFKAYSLSGLYGHLLNLWAYPTTDTMDYTWWSNAAYEKPAKTVATYMDYGLNYTGGDKTKSEFIKTVSIARDKEKEKSIYIRISVDAMAGFDQVARLDLDWDNAVLVTEASTESSTEMSTESSTEISTESSTEATTKKVGSDSSSTDKYADGKYWMDIALWNANIDQMSMGDSAFDNNRKALVTISGDTADIRIATNPVSVSGYTSALQDIKSDDVNIEIESKKSFTTNTRYDGKEHRFDYVSVFGFKLGELNKEYINVQISVPYTPMDGVTASTGGYVAARLKLDWSNMEQAGANDKLVPDGTSASGSSSSGGSGGGSSTNSKSKDTGIKVEADSYVLPDDVKVEAKSLQSGTTYTVADNLLDNDFKLYSIIATSETNGGEVSPEGTADIYFPVNENDGNVAIYRVVEGDKNTEPGITELEYKLSDDGKYYVVTAKEFGLFAVVKDEEKEEALTDAAVEEEPVSAADKTEVSFMDIKGHWAEKYIVKATKSGLFSGMEEDMFGPDVKTTRAMFVTVLGRLKGVSDTASGSVSFEDINESDYFFPYVLWADKNAIAKGISEKEFSPSTNITREQMATMLYNYTKSEGVELKSICRTEFSDNNDISSWAAESVQALAGAGIISGRSDGTFDPKGNATRAEIATVLVKLVEEYMEY